MVQFNLTIWKQNNIYPLYVNPPLLTKRNIPDPHVSKLSLLKAKNYLFAMTCYSIIIRDTYQIHF